MWAGRLRQGGGAAFACLGPARSAAAIKGKGSQSKGNGKGSENQNGSGNKRVSGFGRASECVQSSLSARMFSVQRDEHIRTGGLGEDIQDGEGASHRDCQTQKCESLCSTAVDGSNTLGG